MIRHIGIGEKLVSTICPIPFLRKLEILISDERRWLCLDLITTSFKGNHTVLLECKDGFKELINNMVELASLSLKKFNAILSDTDLLDPAIHSPAKVTIHNGSDNIRMVLSQFGNESDTKDPD